MARLRRLRVQSSRGARQAGPVYRSGGRSLAGRGRRTAGRRQDRGREWYGRGRRDPPECGATYPVRPEQRGATGRRRGCRGLLRRAWRGCVGVDGGVGRAEDRLSV